MKLIFFRAQNQHDLANGLRDCHEVREVVDQRVPSLEQRECHEQVDQRVQLLPHQKLEQRECHGQGDQHVQLPPHLKLDRREVYGPDKGTNMYSIYPIRSLKNLCCSPPTCPAASCTFELRQEFLLQYSSILTIRRQLPTGPAALGGNASTPKATSRFKNYVGFDLTSSRLSLN